MAYIKDGKFFDSKDVEITEEQYNFYVEREAEKQRIKEEHEQHVIELKRLKQQKKKDKEAIRKKYKEQYKQLKLAEAQELKNL